MRIIFSILLALLSISNIQSQSLELDATTNMYVMKGIIQCDSSFNRKALYELSKEWIVKNLKSSDNNINLDDKEFKQMTATGNVEGKDMNYTINFKLTIDVKDGKVRYTFENISYASKNSKFNFPIEKIQRKNKLQIKTFEDVEQTLATLAKSLNASLLQDPKKRDNW